MGKRNTVPSVNAFWYSILKDRFAGDRPKKYLRLSDGDVVQLKGVFLSEWAPKIPGRVWTLEGFQDFEEGQSRVDRYVTVNDKVYAVLDPYGKGRVVSAGFGSIRIARRRGNDDNFAYMTLVDEAAWHVDRGVPVVVSRPVYEKFQRYSRAGAPWLESIEGIIRIDDDLPFAELIPSAIGAKLSPESESTLRYRPGLPRCYLHVTSPLTVKFKYNDSHPPATAWTMFKTSIRREPYRFTYTGFDPRSPDSIEEAVSFINWYIAEYDGVGAITDFDGRRPRLEAAIPIRSDPLRYQKTRARALVKNCDRWVRDGIVMARDRG